MIRRILAIIFGVLIGGAAVGAIWYSAAPREFLQTFMSDETYAAFTVTQNAGRVTKSFAKTAKAQTAYSYDVTVDANVDKSVIFGSDTAAEAISGYLDTLSAGGNVYFEKNSMRATTSIADKDAPLFTGEMIFTGRNQFFRSDQLGEKWFYRTNEVPTPSGNSGKSGGYVVKKTDTKVTIADAETTIPVGSITATGEAITMTTPIEEFEAMLASISGEGSMSAGDLIKYFKSKNVKEAVLTFYVNKKNQVTAVSGILSDDKGASVTGFSFAKDESKEGVYAFEYDTDKIYANADIKVSKAPFESFSVPEKSKAIPMDSDSMKSQLQNYIFGELMNNHPQLKEAFNALINKLIGDAFGGLAESFFSAFGAKGAA